LSLEMSAAPLNHFMGTIGKAYPDKNTLNRNFLVAPFGTPINLDTPEGQVFFDQIMNDHMPDILIIDSLQKVASKELTDEQAVKNLIHYLSTIRSKYSCAMLMIHHNRKKANDGQKKGVELSDVYGSTYITTDVDFVLSLKVIEGDLLQVDTLKNRLGPTPDAFTITRNPDNLSLLLTWVMCLINLKRTLILNFESIEAESMKVLDYLAGNPGSVISLDTEATGLRVAGDDTCIGVSLAAVINDTPISHYFPFFHKTGENCSSAVLLKLKEVLEEGNHTLVFCNVQYDILSLNTILHLLGPHRFY